MSIALKAMMKLLILSYIVLIAHASAIPISKRDFRYTKRGVPFNNDAAGNSPFIQKFNVQNSKVTWGYNWDSKMSADYPTHYMNFVPMLWGLTSDHTANWEANIQDAHNRGSTAILAFNEPDLCDTSASACISPADAAAGYKQYMMPYAAQYDLISPAISNGANGIPWMQQFLAACDGCKFYALAVHWYGDATDVAGFQQHLTDVHNTFGKTIWVTEFHGAGSVDQMTDFIQQSVAWLDETPWINRYSAMWASPEFDVNGISAALVNVDATVTDLGHVYATA